MGIDRERERERKGKKGGSIAAGAELPAEAAPCGWCGDPLIEGQTGGREPRGAYHVGCIRQARREALSERDPEAQEHGGGRRRRRRG